MLLIDLEEEEEGREGEEEEEKEKKHQCEKYQLVASHRRPNLGSNPQSTSRYVP